MRRRLFRSSLVIAVVSVVLLGVPLGVAAGNLVRGNALSRLDREAEVVALAVESDDAGARVPTSILGRFVAATSHVEIVSATGVVELELGRAGRWDHDLHVSRPLPSGRSVRVSADAASVRRRQLEAWLVIAAASAATIGVAVAVASAQARRLSAPLRNLADASARLGAGEFPVDIPLVGMEEMDAVAVRLTESSEQLHHLLVKEREFSANASHQLRSALTALRLRVDELHGPANESVEAVERQMDRLERTITDLIAASRPSTSTTVDVVPIVAERVEVWRAALARQGRAVEVDVGGSLVVPGSKALVRQVLDVLLDNAVRHGGGTVRVEVADQPSGAIVRVSDAGGGVCLGQEEWIFQRGTSTNGTGIGLALARDLVEQAGGRIVLGRAQPPVFEVYLARSAARSTPR